MSLPCGSRSLTYIMLFQPKLRRYYFLFSSTIFPVTFIPASHETTTGSSDFHCPSDMRDTASFVSELSFSDNSVIKFIVIAVICVVVILNIIIKCCPNN